MTVACRTLHKMRPYRTVRKICTLPLQFAQWSASSKLLDTLLTILPSNRRTSPLRMRTRNVMRTPSDAIHPRAQHLIGAVQTPAQYAAHRVMTRKIASETGCEVLLVARHALEDRLDHVHHDPVALNAAA